MLAVILAAAYPVWSALPLLTAFAPLQVVFGLIVFLLEIILMIGLIIAVIDGRIRLVLAAAVVGLAAGVTPGIGIFPVFVLLPVWLKAVAPAVAVGVFINHGFKPGKSFAFGALLTALFLLVTYLQGSAVLGEQMSRANAMIEKIVTGQMASGGYDQAMANNLTDQLLYVSKIVTRLMPGLIIMSGIAQLFVAFLVTEWYFTRRDSFFPGFGPFIYWKVPEKLLYFLGVVLVVRLTIAGVVQIAADNVVFMLLISYAVCGLGLIEFALRRLRLPVLVRTIFYIGLGLMHVIGLIGASIAGLFDSYFDFRKVRAHTLG